jgi:sigma-E factor negative regulatory protein RseC
MIEETAIVVKCEGEFAWVEAQRQSACSSCSANKACGTGVLSKMVGRKVSRMKALNRADARVGDTVVIGLNEAALIKGSLAVYLMPLLFMISFAVTGRLVAAQMLWPDETVVILFALAGLGMAAVWLRRFTSRIQHDDRYQAVILRRKTTVPSGVSLLT